MSNFLTYTNPAVAKDSEIADLKLQVRALSSQLDLANLRANNLEMLAVEADEECPECEDIAALEQVCNAANYDVMDAQQVVNSELKTGAYWHRTFCAKGLAAEAGLLNDLMCVLLLEREYQLSIAAHNVAFCKADGAAEYIDAKKAELELLLAAKPDMDTRCVSYINKILACV